VRDNESCLALERLAPQGRKFRLGFRRVAFHRRARNFDDHRIIVARLGGEVVGTAAMAFKDVRLLGEPRRAAFHFDLRVHPEHRNRGIGSRLTDEAVRLGGSRSDVGYWYVVGDNRALRGFTRSGHGTPVSGYTYLVCPTYRERPSRVYVRPSTMAEVHQRLLDTAPPFDFYTDPLAGGDVSAHVASWMTVAPAPSAGCSAWDNSEILAEAVEAVPAGLRLARGLFESRIFRGHSHPHVPRPGEQLRSWYLFDVFGSEPGPVVDLVRFVSARAREAGIDYLYIPWVAGDEWVGAVKADLPRLFSPEICYVFYCVGWAGQPRQLRRIYVDIRDL